MRILFTILATALIGMSLPGVASARVNVHIDLGFPPPPAVVFDSEPHVVLVPRTRVYYVPDLDYDLYRYGPYWYVNRDGYWYRATSYRGPFTPVVYERVPRSIVVIPRQYHRFPVRPVRGRGGPPHHIEHHIEHHELHGGGHGHGGHGHHDHD